MIGLLVIAGICLFYFLLFWFIGHVRGNLASYTGLR